MIIKKKTENEILHESTHRQSYLENHLAANVLSDYVIIIQTLQLSYGFRRLPLSDARLASR